MVSETNSRTLTAYENRYTEYIRLTPRTYQKNHIPLLRWLDTTTDKLPPHSSVLEIGSGTGREALYLQRNGFDVTASDAVTGFVKHLEQLELKTLRLNLLKDPVPKGYALILANAVISHFTPNELHFILKKVRGALHEGDFFAFSAKQGYGEKWVNEKFSEKRYTHFWQPDTIKKTVEAEGFKLVFMESHVPGDTAAHTWINLSVQK